MKMRIVLPAAAALTITAFAIISFARGAEVTAGKSVVLDETFEANGIATCRHSIL